MPRLYSANIGAGGGGGGVLVVRAGTGAIANGSNTVSVVFTSPLSSTNYAVNFTIDNEVDADPQYLQGLVTVKDVAGFTVLLNAPTDSANYQITYMVCEYV